MIARHAPKVLTVAAVMLVLAFGNPSKEEVEARSVLAIANQIEADCAAAPDPFMCAEDAMHDSGIDMNLVNMAMEYLK